MRLALILSKQVDGTIANAEGTRECENFTITLYKHCLSAIESNDWQGVVTNSQTLAGALNLNTWAGRDDFNPVGLCRFLWDCSHVVAFWAGGPNFQQFLEACMRMRASLQKGVRIYACDVSNLTIERIDLSTFRSSHAR